MTLPLSPKLEVPGPPLERFRRNIKSTGAFGANFDSSTWPAFTTPCVGGDEYEVRSVWIEATNDRLGRLGVGDVSWPGRRTGRVCAVDADVDLVAADDAGRGVVVVVWWSPLDPDGRRVDHICSQSPWLAGNYVNIIITRLFARKPTER